MDKIFAVEDGTCCVKQNGAWHRCVITPDAVEVLEERDVRSDERYTLYEMRAKISGARADSSQPEQEGDPPCKKAGAKSVVTEETKK